jgi:hypothetical protein
MASLSRSGKAGTAPRSYKLPYHEGTKDTKIHHDADTTGTNQVVI